jgi:glycosyltransferase 2 family protein
VARARKWIFLALQIALAALFVWLAWREIAPRLSDVGPAWSLIDIRIAPLAGSGLFVILAYLVLIETWRRVITAWGSGLPFGPAARIWFVSNLGRYVPGKVWTIAAMGTLSQRAGVSPAVAVASALYINAINILAGIAVCLLAAPGRTPIPPVVAVILGVLTVVFVLTPRALTTVVKWIAARMGRDYDLPPLAYTTIALTFASCAIAWVFYGIAFQLLAAGTIGDPSGATSGYVALYTSSYLLGFIAFFAPGGAGVRESAMIAQAGQYALMPAPSMLLLAAISRIWLTLFELLPGLVLLVVTPKPSMTPSNETRTH